MSESNSHTDHQTQRVNAAIAVAVRRRVSEAADVENRRALEVSIGRRLQGAYGAELRAKAEAAPDLSVAELCQNVIFAAEYPDDTPQEVTPPAGARARARRAESRHLEEPAPRYTPPTPELMAAVRSGDIAKIRQLTGAV